MNWIRREKRLAIYLRDHFRCAYCDRDLSLATPRDLTLDHLVPACHGGTNDATNLVTACDACNTARGATPLSEFVHSARWWQIVEQVSRPLNLELGKALCGRSKEASA